MQPTFVPLSQDRLYDPPGNQTFRIQQKKLRCYTYSEQEPDQPLVDQINDMLDSLFKDKTSLQIIGNEIQFMFGEKKQFWPQYLLLGTTQGIERDELIADYQQRITKYLETRYQNQDWSSGWIMFDEAEDIQNGAVPPYHYMVVTFFDLTLKEVYHLQCPKYGICIMKDDQ